MPDPDPPLVPPDVPSPRPAPAAPAAGPGRDAPLPPAPGNAFRLPLVVAQTDIYGAGHASNRVVIAWMERAAEAHSAAVGWDVDAFRRAGGMFVVRRWEVDYYRSALLDDALVVLTWPDGLRRTGGTRQYRVVRQADGHVVAAGLTVWAYVALATGRPTAIPAEAAAAFDPAQFQ